MVPEKGVIGKPKLLGLAQDLDDRAGTFPQNLAQLIAASAIEVNHLDRLGGRYAPLPQPGVGLPLLTGEQGLNPLAAALADLVDLGFLGGGERFAGGR